MKTGQKLAMFLGLANMPGSASLVARSENQEPEDYFGFPRKQRGGEYGAWQVKMADMEAHSALTGFMDTLQAFKKEAAPTPKPAEESPVAEAEAPDPLDAFIARRAAERSTKDDAAETPTTESDAAKASVKAEVVKSKTIDVKEILSNSKKDQAKDVSKKESKESTKVAVPKPDEKPDAPKTSVKVEIVKSKTIKRKEAKEEDKKDKTDKVAKKDKKGEEDKDDSKDKEDKKDKEGKKDKDTKKDNETKKGKDDEEDKEDKKDKEGKKDNKDKEAKKGKDNEKDKKDKKGKDDEKKEPKDNNDKNDDKKDGKDDKKDDKKDVVSMLRSGVTGGLSEQEGHQILFVEGNLEASGMSHSSAEARAAEIVSSWHKKATNSASPIDESLHENSVSVLSEGASAKDEQAKIMIEENMEASGASHIAAEAQANAIVKEGHQISAVVGNLEAGGMSHSSAEAQAAEIVSSWHKKATNSASPIDESLHKNSVSVMSEGAGAQHFTAQEDENYKQMIMGNIEKDGVDPITARAEAEAIVREQKSSTPALRGSASEQKQDKKIATLVQTSAKVTFAEEDADSQNEEQAMEAESEQLRKEIADAKGTLTQAERELA